MKSFPSNQELLRKYQEVLSNKTVTAISNWRQSNTDSPTDERAYLGRGLKNASLIKDQFCRTIKNLRFHSVAPAKN
jgi:hypothetical protein